MTLFERRLRLLFAGVGVIVIFFIALGAFLGDPGRIAEAIAVDIRGPEFKTCLRAFELRPIGLYECVVCERSTYDSGSAMQCFVRPTE